MDFTSREIRVYPFLFPFVQMFKKHFAEDAGIREADRIWVRGWFPVIFELSCIMHQSIPSTNIPPGNFFKVVKFPAPGQKSFAKLWPRGKKIDKNPAPGDNFVDLQDNFAMIVKPFAFFWYSSLAWLSSSFFKNYKACEYKISQ